MNAGGTEQLLRNAVPELTHLPNGNRQSRCYDGERIQVLFFADIHEIGVTTVCLVDSLYKFELDIFTRKY